MKKSLVSPSYLKQRAKQLQKSKSMPWHQALNEAAREFECSNYKNYLNVMKRSNYPDDSPKLTAIRMIASEELMSKKEELAISFIRDNLIPFTDLIDILRPFRSLKSFPSICERANLKEDIKTCINNDFTSDEGKNHISTFYKSYIAKEITLGKLNYDMNNELITIIGLFKLDVTLDSKKSDKRLKSKLLFGTFKMLIDSHDIDMKYSVGHAFDNFCHSGSKSYFEYHDENCEVIQSLK